MMACGTHRAREMSQATPIIMLERFGVQVQLDSGWQMACVCGEETLATYIDRSCAHMGHFANYRSQCASMFGLRDSSKISVKDVGKKGPRRDFFFLLTTL